MNRLLLAVISAGIAWLNLASVHAQSAVPIYSFSAGATNGAYPEASLTVGPDGNFYGTTEGGGINNNGTVFMVTPGGTQTTLVKFNGFNGSSPLGNLLLGPDGNFYGTTEYGGSTFGNSSYDAGLGDGTVFRMTTNGVLTTLANFSAANGNAPHDGLALGPDGNFYGTTASGGPNGLTYGTIFKITPGGTLTSLTNFDASAGIDPTAGLVLGPDGNFYGTTSSSGGNDSGSVFKVTTNGVLTTLYSFGTTATNGADPAGTLILGPDGNLYGVTSYSSLVPYTVFPGFTIELPTGNGTIFQITTNGTLTTLVDFDNYTAGTLPFAGLIQGPDGNLYGTTDTGGASNLGTIYKVTTNGTLTTLVSFAGTNGANPEASLTLGPDDNFYGTASSQGASTNGTVFAVELPPEFLTSPANQSVIIGNPATFNATLFSTTPYGLQWLSNSVPVTGATGSSLTIPHVFWSANNAQFQLVATNTYGGATNSPATLTVLLQPNSYGITNNGNGQYTILAAGTPNSANRLWSTTNLALPLAQWQPSGKINMDANGMGQLLDTDTSDSQKFYLLSYP